jgi:hypothetical protein
MLRIALRLIPVASTLKCADNVSESTTVAGARKSNEQCPKRSKDFCRLWTNRAFYCRRFVAFARRRANR